MTQERFCLAMEERLPQHRARFPGALLRRALEARPEARGSRQVARSDHERDDGGVGRRDHAGDAEPPLTPRREEIVLGRVAAAC